MKTRANINNFLVMSVLLLAMVSTAAGQTIYYVDASATGANDGSNWNDAYNYLKDALTVATSCDEIWVAEGVYKPDEDTANPTGTGYRTATFQLISGVAIYGGFGGESILSGDLNGDDGPDFANNGDNSYHVVNGSGTDETAILDDFTITAGKANWYPPHNMGAGMYNYEGSPTVSNCTFSGNTATGYNGIGGGMNNTLANPTVSNCTFSGNTADTGGGMYNGEYSSPTLTDCTFSDNSAGAGGGMYNGEYSSPTLTDCTFSENSAGAGGGMYNYFYSNPPLTNCTFSGNSAGNGGGMLNWSFSSPTLTDCTFSENSSEWNGGGMNNGFCSPTLTDCTFNENSAENGGGMYSHGSESSDSEPTLTRCTFSGNSASQGGGMYNQGGQQGIFGWSDTPDPTLTNCTFRENTATKGGGMYNSFHSNLTVDNCTFSKNSATNGGGMYNWFHSNPTVDNCTFSKNSATNGGAISNAYFSSPTVTNCTFGGNSASAGGAISNAGWDSCPTVTNCILWGDTPDEVVEGGPVITYSDVQGGWSGTGNINADPMFADADLRLSPGSPCIDAGDNTAVPDGVTTDLDGNPRIFNDIVDMGAYECEAEPTNQAPVANAGPNQTVECTSVDGAEVQLDGSGSSDPDGDPLTYSWTWDGEYATGVSPTVALPLGTTTITLVVNDGTADSVPDTVDITVEDTTPPEVDITIPAPGAALQDGVTLTAEATDLSGVSELYFYIREPDGGGSGVPIGPDYEDIPATLTTTPSQWECSFDTTELPDGYYVILAKAVDTQGNEGWSPIVPFSIRNWAVVELLPASESNKAGRTMPVKFSLRIAEGVDAAMPFVYNEELEVIIYDVEHPGTILQTSLCGDTSRDYRIDSVNELYITNFKTKKEPAEYMVEIWRTSNDFLVGSFTFETVK